jgi:hypothetical protein
VSEKSGKKREEKQWAKMLTYCQHIALRVSFDKE